MAKICSQTYKWQPSLDVVDDAAPLIIVCLLLIDAAFCVAIVPSAPFSLP